MQALADAVGFIPIMHPRGDVFIPGADAALLTRGSVWVEQQIAIAAYIDRQRKQRLLTPVYCHETAGREGMRDLLHLNPMKFRSNEEILADLRNRIQSWRPNESIDEDGELFLKASPSYMT